MKKLKNAMLFTIGGLAFATIAITSCSKSSPGASTVPTITSITPSPIVPGDTVIITGTNFATGATITVDGGTPSSSGVTVVSSTEITVITSTSTPQGTHSIVITVGSQASTAYNVTVGSAGPNSDSVAKAYLIAHWTFDASSVESGSRNPASTITGVTFGGSGQIGGCATFTDGYLLYPIIPAIDNDTALQSYSISMWVNIPADSNNTGILRSLFQVNPNTYADIWGVLSLSLNNNGVGADTLPLRADQVQIDDRGPTQATTSTNLAGGVGTWTFITETYNGYGSNQTLELYANGNRVDSTQFTDVNKSGSQSTFRIVPGGGPLFPVAAANYVSIGTLAFFDRGNSLGNGYTPETYSPSAADRPWASGSITGQIDDIRLFNRALTQAQVDSLYGYGLLHK